MELRVVVRMNVAVVRVVMGHAIVHQIDGGMVTFLIVVIENYLTF